MYDWLRGENGSRRLREERFLENKCGAITWTEVIIVVFSTCKLHFKLRHAKGSENGNVKIFITQNALKSNGYRIHSTRRRSQSFIFRPSSPCPINPYGSSRE